MGKTENTLSKIESSLSKSDIFVELPLIRVQRSEDGEYFTTIFEQCRRLSSSFSRFAVCSLSVKVLLRVGRYLLSRVPADLREIKLDVTWSCVKRQTAKLTSEIVFFSSNPSLNYIKIEKCLLLFATNTNIFTLLFKELKTDGKSFIFAV